MSILGQLESDILAWEVWLAEQGEQYGDAEGESDGVDDDAD